MATIIEETSIITINNFPNPYTYLVATATSSIEVSSHEEALSLSKIFGIRHVSKEEARAYSLNKIKNLKVSNPEFFKN